MEHLLLRSKCSWLKVFRIIPEFRILRLVYNASPLSVCSVPTSHSVCIVPSLTKNGIHAISFLGDFFPYKMAHSVGIMCGIDTFIVVQKNSDLDEKAEAGSFSDLDNIILQVIEGFK